MQGFGSLHPPCQGLAHYRALRMYSVLKILRIERSLTSESTSGSVHPLGTTLTSHLLTAIGQAMHAKSIFQLRQTKPSALLGLVVLSSLMSSNGVVACTDPDSPLATENGHYSVPLFLSAANPTRHGFLRIVNRSSHPGTVRIHAIDDAGMRFGPVNLELGASSAAHLDSIDLECGDLAKGLSGGVGRGQGEWRLELATTLDILARSYVRTSDGFLTRLTGTSALGDGNSCVVDFFNPASNHEQVSRLRLVNTSNEIAEIAVTGTDDRGQHAPGEVRLTIPAGETRTLTAHDIESGAPGVSGRLGEGTGKWRLSVSSDRSIEVTNLLSSTTGYLTVASPCEQAERERKVVVSESGLDDTSEWGTASYELGQATIANDTLRLTVSFGGGCRMHEFTLVLSNAFMMTDPVRLGATLAHNANDDPCEAWLTEDLVFDLAPVRELYGDHGSARASVILMLSASDGTGRELLYEF